MLAIFISAILFFGGCKKKDPLTAIDVPAPSDVEIISFTPEKIQLRWTDKSANETGFVIEVSVDSGKKFTQLTTTPTDRESVTVYTAFQPEKVYDFRIGAMSNATAIYSMAASSKCWRTFIASIEGQPDDEGYSIQQTSDGGYIIGGSWDLMKTDSRGTKVWRSDIRSIYSVLQNPDGGYIGGGRYVSLQKFNATGSILWVKNFGFIQPSEYTSCVLPTSEGGFVLLGNMFTPENKGLELTLIKTDGDGNEVWRKYYGGPQNDLGKCVFQTSDGGYIIAGSSRTFASDIDQLYIVKTDTAGNLQWEKRYGGGTVQYAGNSVVQNDDGSYTICGSTAITKGLQIKVDTVGAVLWEKIFDEANAGPQLSIVRSNDNGYVVAGASYSRVTGSPDLMLMKSDANGTVLWRRIFGGDNTELGYCVLRTADGGYIVSGAQTLIGSGMTRTYLVKTDDNGIIH
ncbi:MAG: fibronectin type III domain-containing protein [Bacteroidota bacterium]|nr:fibronectin type III domain-containing protein [Bacteroidota bacterium]